MLPVWNFPGPAYGECGKAFAAEVRNILGDLQKQKILILVGPGNNGGDGLVAARYLHDWGARVRVYPCGKRSEPDPTWNWHRNAESPFGKRTLIPV